ncbi:midasin [Ceratina calcarata]|uniref:Midasin n=2 Tax=Ceratina calcarata TaxID=156304 RepID=A0AAJ7J7V3_9HYME|nr:midasin [Ceratina calcarata]
MFSQKVTAFVKRKESYVRKLSFYKTDKEPNDNEYKRIVDILCKFLMNPDSTEDVAECFLEILDVLVIRSISVAEPCSSDALHRLNSVILGKLLHIDPNLLVYVQRYFDKNPAPFQSVEIDGAPVKRCRIEETEVFDYELVTSCYNILCSAPMYFKHKWNWSKFYQYLTHDAEGVRWVAINCLAVVLDMSESCYLSHVNSFTEKHQEFSIEFKKLHRNIVTTEGTIELDEILDEPLVVSIGGILLPVFQKSTLKTELNLVPVPSTRRNLQNLALAVSSNKCVCLQGAVGSGKTALVEFLAQATGRDAQSFARVQLGDQTDSKMLLGMYRCTDIPGEFLWEPGILTEAVQSGKWLLLEDIDCAATDVVSVVRQLVENKTLSVPGYRDSVQARTGFQLFVTRRLTSGSQTSQISLQKEWFCVNVESLSKDELVTIVQTMFPILNTIATRLVDVYLVFVARHEDVVKHARLISTRDLIKWCSRAIVDFDVSSPTSALKIFQDALDTFCCSVPNSVQRSNLAVAVAHKLGIVKTKAEYFCDVHKPTINIHSECLIVGRAKLRVKKADRVKLESRNANFSYTRPSVCLLERIASCVVQKEPVLLVGETGTGKTSCVQYLAQITGHKLIVINMNQQSESTDLLGGYKPVDLKLLIRPIREEFEIAFRSYFEIKPNQKFLSHLARCFEDRKWKTLTSLMIHSSNAALRRLQVSSSSQKEMEMLKKWQKIVQKLEKLQTQVQSQYSLAFSFVEGSLVKALKNGDWVLLDEINLATAETLECLSGLLEGSCGSLSLLERGDKEPIERHQDFAIFACMNPATDIGKRDLPVGLRNRFTEFFVDELTEKSDLQLLVNSYLKDLNLPSEKIAGIVKFYLNVRKETETSLLDGTGHKPHYSLRTLCRALSVSAKNPCANALRSLYEAFCLSFLTQLDSNSYPVVQRMIVKAILGEKAASAIISTPIPRPRGHDSFICFEGYWIPKGDLEPQLPRDYILTETVRQNLKDLVRVVSIGKMPVLLQGDTSVGKTSLITYLAKASGHSCVRINNHEHTDLQEYIGTYVADSTGRLVFKEGVLVDAMRKGHWIILDELNLAPSDVLEALNRVLDDNRELFIPETQQVVKAHENFMLFATQNPPGLYGGRKVLSRAFRNRFVELHFDEIPPKELQVILQKRCKMPETYCKQVINVMTELQLRRKSTATFAGKKGFITLRDLFRWAERYHLAPDTGTSLYDWSQHLADEGYLVLSSKVRRQEECSEIIQVLKKHLKRDVDPEALFSLSEKTSTVTKPILQSLLSGPIPGFEHLVWTFQMRKMAVLLSKACDFKEPVLLIGETGGGKTTVCQLLAAIRKQRLSIINCHMHTEASDFLGSLRPVREHQSQKLFEWVDGPLVNAMKDGGFFVVDEISLADDSVLERLNSLLEPERKLLIAEKQSDEENETVTAHENFIFVGTMNPGGDYGKKELSPALRNRFTEIWCEGCVSSDDLKSIMVHNLREELKETVSTAIIQFIEWLKTTEIGKRLVVSVRDILTWVNFVNCCENFEIGDAFFHGAALSYIDGLGSGLTAAENTRKLKDFKESALKFIEQQIQSTLKSKLTLNRNEYDVESREGKFGIPPFYISKGNEDIPSNVGFAFNNPTTRSNTLKVLRALQLRKPILLEGSPGVGKTSLVSALARASGHRLLRLNLSDQTDISDLFGADLPVEGGKSGEFSWRDGPFLRALKNGDWILLDELNLASQSVLEGLNACLDHRGEVYIPELGMSFVVKPGTRLFGCQNPLRQGGGRRGLPKSFLNRFTQVFVDTLEKVDLQCILKMQFTELPEDLIDKMIQFNEELSSQIGTTWGHSGSPWEMNLRDLTRWCEITIANFKRDSKKTFNIGNGAQLIYVDRMRTVQDKNNVKEIYDRIFGQFDRLPEPEFPIHLTKERVFLGNEILDRSDFAVYGNDDLLLLREQKTALKGLAQCVNMNWMAILIGGSGTGKSSLVHLLANLAGQKLKSIVVNSAMDTTEILGGFEQTDYNRHLEELLERTEALLIKILRKNLDNKNLENVAHYHGLLENVRHLFEGDDKTMGTNMSTETKLFLRKTEELSKLVSAMGTEDDEELALINKKLNDLSIAVEKDNCLNAGGKFEWVDSVLVKSWSNKKAMKHDQEIDLQDLLGVTRIVNGTSFLKHVLLDFYERSLLNDLEVRRIWSSKITSKCEFGLIAEINECLGNEAASLKFLFENKSAVEVPFGLVEPSTANNFAIVLYFRLMMLECGSERKFVANEDVIRLEEYSAAVRSGKLSSNLKNVPLILNFSNMIEQSSKFIHLLLRNENLSLTDKEYVEVRDGLRWYQRYQNLGTTKLVDKTRGTFYDLKEISSSLEVHYKWLRKFIKKLLAHSSLESFNLSTRTKIKHFSATCLNEVTSNDDYRKFRKLVKKQLPIPSPHLSESSMSFDEKLRSVSRRLRVTDEDLIDPSRTKWKIIVLALNLSTRKRLIEIYERDYKIKLDEHRDWSQELTEIEEIAVSISEPRENSDNSDKIDVNVEAWPIYEFFFLLSTYRFLKLFKEDNNSRDYCEKIYKDDALSKFEEVPTIPAGLIGLIKTLNSRETSLNQSVFLQPELLSSFFKFAQRSFAIENSHVLLNWRDIKETEEILELNKNEESNFIHNSTLFMLIFDLLSSKSGNRGEINFGNYKSRKRMFDTLRALLWKNSLILNSQEFDVCRNDASLLIHCIDYYLSHVDEVLDTFLNEYNSRKQNERWLQFLKAIRSLREIKERSNEGLKAIDRGLGWLALGYLQMFIFQDPGTIDPVHKVILKSKYAREDVNGLEQLMLVENIQCSILGIRLSDEKRSSRVDRLATISSKAKNLESLRAVRPASRFQNLREDLENFSSTVGSYETIFCHGRRLRKASESNKDFETLQVAFIWKKSLERFADKLERNFLVGFPDVVSPVITAVSNLRHGVSILIGAVKHFMNSTNRDLSLLLRFPVSSQQNYMSLVEHSLKMYCQSELACKEKLNLLRICLKEMENFSAIGKQTAWNVLQKSLKEVRSVWMEQETQRETLAREKENMYDMRVATKLEEEEEYEKAFPDHQQDFIEFSDLQKPLNEVQKAPEDKETFVELISTMDARIIQEMHWNILNNCSGEDSIKIEPDFVGPLVQRFEIYGPQLKTLEDSHLVSSLLVLIAQKSNFGDRNTKKGVYDFYRDPNVAEVEECQSLFDRLQLRVNEFLEEWPENPILNSIKVIVDRLLGFPVDSSLSKFLVGVELLLTKIKQWEENARHDVSLAEFVEAFGEKVLRWRKLEISRWKDSLEVLEDDLKTEASRWWFFLFDLVDEYSNELSSKTVESLERFLTESPLIEYEARLRLVYLFYRHVRAGPDAARQDELSRILWNVFFYYSRFLNDVKAKIQALKEPVAKKVKDTIKITRWNDVSYWSVRNTAEKTRRTLHKFVREFKKGLQQNVACCLTLKSKVEPLETSSRRELRVCDFLIETKPGKQNKTEKLVQKARLFCEEIITSSNYDSIRRDIETFIEESLEESRRLRNVEVDKSLTKAKQQAQLKSILQQKKMALANYFKTLSRLGISYRKGILAWKNRKETVINFKTMVLDLERIQRLKCGQEFENLDIALMEQWSGCEKYYYESLVKLNSLDSIFSTGRSVLGMQDAERCRGFSAHLMLLVHKQKETVADFFNFFLPFRIQATNLALMMKDTREITNIVNVPGDLVDRFLELLIELEISIRQIIIVLESCPVESLADEDSLDLNETVVPVLQDGSVSRDLLSSMRDSLHLVQNLAKELNAWIAVSRPVKEKNSKFLFHRRHLEFLRKGYQTIERVKEKLDELGGAFHYNHPIYDHELIEAINNSRELFKSTLDCIEDVEEYRITDLEDFEMHPDHITGSRSNVLNALIKQILLAVQKRQENQKSIEVTSDDVNEEDFKENLMTDELIESLRNVVQDLRLTTVWDRLSKLVDAINSGNDRLANMYMRLLSQYVPLLQQYTLLLHYYLYEQVASFRLTCKFLYLQLNVFLDLATNGFCQPDDADGAQDEGEGGTSEGGMGLAEGEGKKDVSDRIESEDQLEDARQPNEEEKEEKKDTKEEEKGIEMSENFEGHLEDLGEREENEDNDEDDDLDKEMGETDETAEKLDEEIWKDEEEENNEEESREDQKEERGTGEKTGQEELGAGDDNEKSNKDEEQKDGDRKEEEKEINEFKEPEVDDDQVDPYHGNTQPEVEPEAFDLPEDVNLDEEAKEEDGANEEDPFDIDQMKDSKLPEEREEELEETKEAEDNEQQNSSGDEDEEGDQEDANRKGDEKTAVDPEEEKEDAEKENEEQNEMEEGDKAPASFDVGSKQVDASEEVQSKKDGSRDAVESQSNQEQMDIDSTESSVNENKDKGTGQSQTEEREGHSGAKQEEDAPASSEKDSKSAPQRRKPGKSDENRSLLDDDAASAPKKLKTDAMQRNLDQEEEEREKQKGGESEAYEHIENSEKFDDYVFDAATEEQIKKQASNLEEDKEKQADDDVEMHEDTEEPMDQEEETRKEKAEKVADGKKDKSTSAKGDRSDEVEQIDLTGEVEGETVETTRVLRGNESSIHTKLDETESFDISTCDIVQKRSEIESMLAKWSQGPSSVEAANAWSSITALTESAARELSEKLRLVLEPTLTSRLKGDYRTGRRINMRKVIPYIASEFRKDKIWLRRTKPSKRDYQVVLAIDDSSSMADNHSKELAFESLSLIGKAMSYLEVGQLAVVNFGERVNILHPFGENFTDESGARLIQEMKFEQKKTMIGQLLDFIIEMFASQGNTSDNAKLVTILSDGRGIFSEGVENVSTAVRKAKLLNIFLVFIIVDNPLNKDSILDIRMPIFEGGKLLGIRSYMDSFPFPFYIILRDLDTLPAVLSDALRQWFEIVGRIDT